MSKKTQTTQPVVAPWVLATLMGLSLAEALLSIYQWAELLKVRAGGVATCSVNETVNCATVWNAPLASWLHKLLGLPVAGLGVVWGLGALVLTVAFALKRPGATVALLRLTALLGAASCVVFAVVSFMASAVCLTCLGTYALVFAYVAVAFRFLPTPVDVSWPQMTAAVLPITGIFVGVFVLVRFLGPLTPLQNETGLKDLSKRSPQEEVPLPATDVAMWTPEQQKLAQFLSNLSGAEKQALADALEDYRQSQVPDVSAFPTRFRVGPELAAVQVVEFTDVLCSHCAHLMKTIEELKRVVPPTLLSLEARYYPLDGECNPQLMRTEGSGVRCLAAKVQICLEGAADFWPLREKLFAEQQTLTKERVIELASSGSVSKEKLLTCVASDETAKKLKDDLQYASEYGIQGTPLVLINGRQGSPMGAFLYTMVMSRADVSSPVLRVLPKPSVARGEHPH